MNAQQQNLTTVSDYTLLKDGDAFRAPLKDIDPVPWKNVRRKRDPKAFNDLRQTIKIANGVTQGVTVRINPDDPTRLQLLAGYGRVEVSNLEGYKDIPAVFKVADDKLALSIMMSENLSREQLSIVDEIRAAQTCISYFDGDYENAAAKMNWSVKTFRARLLLNQCTEKVLEALREGTISIGHAEILSVFVPSLQEGTLEKIISEKWSVEVLKERAGKAARFLKAAIFDTADCKLCPHNSDFQADLLDNTVGKSKCNKLSCFKEKTNATLSVRKAELEEEFGVVLLAIEKPESDRNTVSEEIVGNEQFTGGCTGCINKIVILKDGINSDSGQVIENQCIDTDCFRKMKSDYVAAQNVEAPSKDKSTKSANSNSQSKKDAKVNPKNPAKEKVVTQSTTAAVIENNKALLRTLGASHFDTNTKFMEAICVSSLIEHSGFSQDAKTRFKHLTELEISSAFNARVMELYSLPVETLALIKAACYSAYLVDSKNMSTNPRELIITALSGDESGKGIALAGWVPTKENLDAYLKQGLISIAKTSGFDKHFDAANGVNAFDKIAKKSKGDMIDVILKTEFDWSGYAPDDYLKCLK